MALALSSALLSTGATPATAAGCTTTARCGSYFALATRGSVTKGLQVSGTLRSGSKALAQRYVALQKRRGQGAGWTKVRRTRTNGKGAFSFTTAGAPKGTQFRVRFAGDRTHTAATSPCKPGGISIGITVPGGRFS